MFPGHGAALSITLSQFLKYRAQKRGLAPLPGADQPGDFQGIPLVFPLPRHPVPDLFQRRAGDQQIQGTGGNQRRHGQHALHIAQPIHGAQQIARAHHERRCPAAQPPNRSGQQAAQAQGSSEKVVASAQAQHRARHHPGQAAHARALARGNQHAEHGRAVRHPIQWRRKGLHPHQAQRPQQRQGQALIRKQPLSFRIQRKPANQAGRDERGDHGRDEAAHGVVGQPMAQGKGADQHPDPRAGRGQQILSSQPSGHLAEGQSGYF